MFFKRKKSLPDALNRMIDTNVRSAMSQAPSEILIPHFVIEAIKSCRETSYEHIDELSDEYQLRINEVIDIIDEVHDKAMKEYIKYPK